MAVDVRSYSVTQIAVFCDQRSKLWIKSGSKYLLSLFRV